MALNNFPSSIPLFVTVTGSVPPFLVESVELQFPGDFVESPEFACMRGELPTFSELFCGSNVVVDLPIYWLGLSLDKACEIIRFYTQVPITKSQADKLLYQLSHDWALFPQQPAAEVTELRLFIWLIRNLKIRELPV
jgi:hypothetical protein